MARLPMALVLLSGLAGSAFAEAPRCAETADPGDAAVEVLRCDGGLVIFAETGAVRSSAAQVSAHRQAIQLDDGALLIVAPAAPFSTLTRDAVAAGQGEWIVVSKSGHTLVEVIQGRVVLRRRVDDAETSFGEGGAKLDEASAERLRAAWRRWRTGR